MLSRRRSQALAHTNFAAVYATLPGNLTVHQNLRFFGLLYNVAGLTRAHRAAAARSSTCTHLRNTRSGVLSSGEQTRLALAKALLNEPRLLLLDEPTASLDPSAADLIRARIRAMATSSGCGILWTSHNMYEVRGDLRSGAVPVARQDPARRRSESAAAAARRRARSRNCSSVWRASRWRQPGIPAPEARMKLRPIAAIVLRQIYLMRSSPTRVLPMVAWVAVDIVLWGFISRYLNSVSCERRSTSRPACSARCCSGISSSRVMQGVTMAFFEDVWSRNFINMFATPMLISEYLAGLVLTGDRHQHRRSGRDADARHGGLRPAVRLARACCWCRSCWCCSCSALRSGVLASAMVLRLGPASEWLVWPIPALLSPFVGVFYPLSTLPPLDAWRRSSAAAVLCVRGDAFGGRGRWLSDRASLIIGVALAALYVAAGLPGCLQRCTATRCAADCWRATARRAFPEGGQRSRST